MDQVFFSYRYTEFQGKALTLSGASKPEGEKASYAFRYLKEKISAFSPEGECLTLKLSQGIPEEIRRRPGDSYRDHPEAYALLADGKEIFLYGATSRALLYAAVTLVQLARQQALTDQLFLFDYPDADVRGYRVYTPGQKQFRSFKSMIDTLVEYKYNTVMIEVGGAMEYRRHPEINQAWVEYCQEISLSPETAYRIQTKTYPWRKDSIHFDNGNGGFITQEEMKEIIAYCRERELTVIPEVPSLSHSDYIVRAHPQLNERAEDAYPDTYCPSNPMTYQILFDILDEVLEVFCPESVNIGHDEYYTSAKCPLCKGKSPVDLYVNDIKTIHTYLKNKNVKAWMWADKFFAGPDGTNAEPEKDVPDLIACRGKVPTDITLLNWAWPTSDHSQERLLHQMGYRLLFGNFDGISRPGYREDAYLHNGGFVSNWGSCEETYMQRNLQNFWLANTAYIFWSADYTNAEAPMLCEKVRRLLYSRYKATLGNHLIELCHTTTEDRKYKFFFDGRFIVDSQWLLGYHTVCYSDGTTAELPVIYGYNIRGSKTASRESFQCSTEGKDVEAIGASYPFYREGEVWYQTAYPNPYPEKTIVSITPACGVSLHYGKDEQ